jgi:hypothetical protein
VFVQVGCSGSGGAATTGDCGGEGGRSIIANEMRRRECRKQVKSSQVKSSQVKSSQVKSTRRDTSKKVLTILDLISFDLTCRFKIPKTKKFAAVIMSHKLMKKRVNDKARHGSDTVQ